MAKLNLRTERKCFLCGKIEGLENHHIYGGANRVRSEKYGLVVHLCHGCHNEPPWGVHFNKERANLLKEFGQAAFEAVFGFDLFIAEFSKNYSCRSYTASQPVLKSYSEKEITKRKPKLVNLQRNNEKAEECLNLRKRKAAEFKEAQKAKASENRKALYQKQKEWLRQRKAELILEAKSEC